MLISNKENLKEIWHILYHGTKEENVESILKNGFKKYTYFSKELSSALKFGGEYVFEVIFPHSYNEEWFINPLCWQIRNKEIILSTRIVRLRKFNIENIMENEKLAEEIFNRSLPYYTRGYL